MTLSLNFAIPRALVRPTGSTRAAIAAIALVGLALRFGLATGPLGNDEVWSLANLSGIGPFWRVLWGISHDNNHFLNSLWLHFVWPWSRDPIWLRLISILAGAATIPEMARLGGRQGATAGAIAAGLLACLSFFQITYSLEARGYASATLGLIIAYGAMERALDDPKTGARRLLALGAGLAFFSHLAAGLAIALFGLIAFAEAIRRGRGVLPAFRGTLSMFWPAALAMAPTLVFVIVGYREMGGFTIGYPRAFGASHTLAALANLAMTTVGLDPANMPQTLFAVTALPVLVLAAIALGAPPERRAAYVGILLVAPVAVLAARLPNTHAPRYFFALSPFLLLLFADSLAAAWRAGAIARVLAVVALAAFGLGNGAALARLHAGEQAPWTQALDRVSASGDLTLASSFDFNVGRTIAYYNLDRGAPLDLVPTSALCERKPGWYVLELAGSEQPDASLSVEGGDCEIHYALTGVFARDTPWQAEWGLYRRADLPK